MGTRRPGQSGTGRDFVADRREKGEAMGGSRTRNLGRLKTIELAGAVTAVALLVAACGGAAATATPAPVPTLAPTATAPRPATPTTSPAATQVSGTTPIPTASPRPVPTSTPVPTQVPAGPQKYGGAFNMRLIGDFRPWDTNDPTGNFGIIHLQQVLNNLVTTQPDKTSVLRPDLAEQWSISPDGKTWEFKLRKGVQWHDGNPFTSRDVAYALDRAKNPPEGTGTHKGRLQPVERVETPDDSTVRVVLSRPSATISAALSVPSLLMYPSHIPDIRGKWSEKPIGTGPFLFICLSV